ncbi:ComF family protein [Desulfotomaculum sp. 1211_IL3151]|uniref:ComF family protein n=1 Tax=Desulfotomaculum sp. 1211_IL3151 TaxID=3084055 RepID=UPI002FD9ED90
MVSFWEALLNLIFPEPPGCKLCGAAGRKPLCSACEGWLASWASTPKCSICGRPSPWPQTTCVSCQQNRPPFVLARAVGPYEGNFREAIHRLKYKGRKNLTPLLGKFLLTLIMKEPELKKVDGVLPVPLSPKRMRQRGFNQAELLAIEVARDLQKPLLKNVLIKPVETAPQTGLNKLQRQENLRGAFRVQDPSQIKGQNILLVDDVFTTGSTVSAAAETLQSQGAGKIYVVTLAN